MSNDENDHSKFELNGDNYILPDGKVLSAEQMEEKLAADVRKCATSEEKIKAKLVYASFLLSTAKPMEALPVFSEIYNSTEDPENRKTCLFAIRQITGKNTFQSDVDIEIDMEAMYQRLTEYFSATGDFLTALAYFKKASAEIKDPARKAVLHLVLGIACERKDRYKDAIEFYSGAFLLPAGSDSTWYFLNNNIGYSLMREKQFAEAEAYCREAIRIDPSRLNAHKNLGLALQGQGRLREAVYSFVEAVIRNPLDPRAYDHLKELLEENPDIRDAIPDLEEKLLECRKAIARLGIDSTGQDDPKLVPIIPFPPNEEVQDWINNSIDPKAAYFAFRFALAYNTFSPEYIWGMISKDAVYERQTEGGIFGYRGGERIFNRWAKIINRLGENPQEGRAVFELGKTSDDQMPCVISFESFSDIQQDWLDRNWAFIRFQCSEAGRMIKGLCVYDDPPPELLVHSGFFPGLDPSKLRPVQLKPQDITGIKLVLFVSKETETDETDKIATELVGIIASKIEGCTFIVLDKNNFDEDQAEEQKIHPGMYAIHTTPSVIILKEGKILFRVIGLDRIKNLQNEINKAFPIGREN